MPSIGTFACRVIWTVTALAMGGPGVPVAAAITSQSGNLKILVIAGEDAVNIVQQGSAVAPVVEVRDRNGLPLPGALVTFTLQSGRRSAFAGGAQTLTLTTDAAGRAAAAGISPLSGGGLQIQVQAAFQGQTAATVITQTNVMTVTEAAAASVAGGGAGGGGLSGVTIAGLAGGVAAGAIVAAKSAGGSEPPAANSTLPPPTSAAPTVPAFNPEIIAASGIYTLEQVNGSSLPALTIPSPPNSCPGFTDRATLTLTTGPEVYDLSEISHAQCAIGPSGQFNNAHSNGTWSVQGGTITFRSGGDQFNLSPGSLSGAVLTLSFDAPHQTAGNPPYRVTSVWRK